MTVARTTEISATSTQGFDDAIQQGIARATKTLENIKGVWIKDQEIELIDDSIDHYKVTMKVTFVLRD